MSNSEGIVTAEFEDSEVKVQVVLSHMPKISQDHRDELEIVLAMFGHVLRASLLTGDCNSLMDALSDYSNGQVTVIWANEIVKGHGGLE